MNQFPALFLNSEQFQRYPELFAATMELAMKNNKNSNNNNKKTTSTRKRKRKRTRKKTSHSTDGGGGGGCSGGDTNNASIENDEDLPTPIHVLPGTGHPNFVISSFGSPIGCYDS